MNSKKLMLATSIAAAGIALISVRPALAADAPAADAESKEDTLAEIVVTAQKRQESVQSVPLAITVLPAEALQRQGVQQISDLSRMSSALEFTGPGASPGGGAFVRGIGTVSNSLTKNATGSVSIVLDGVVLGNANITDIFDISRVEILRGPQGTLFGSSVSAGVISVTTNAPDPRSMSATASAEYASGDLGSEYQRSSLRAAVNLPIDDKSALRVALHTDDNSGVFHNPYENVSSSQRSTGARVRYLLAPTDDLTINLIADYNRGEDSDVPLNTYRTAPAGSALAVALAGCGVTASDSNFETCTPYYNVYNKTDRGLSAQVDWNVLDGATFTSISSLRKADTALRQDIMAIPLSITQNAFANCTGDPCSAIYQILTGGTNGLQTADRTQYSQELRLASPTNGHFEWVAGVYYQHYKLDDDSPGFLTVRGPAGPMNLNTPIYANVSSQEYAGFGNVTYFLNDATRLIGGARFTHSDISEDIINPFGAGNSDVHSLSTSASKPSWRVGAQHDFSPSTMVYGTVSTGYKSPLISDYLGGGAQMFAVNPELPINYELGIKKSVLDDRLAVDAGIFYEQVKDYQGQACIEDIGGTINCSPTSVSKVNSKGIELDIFGRPLKGLNLNLSATYNPATFPKGYVGSDGTDLGGQQLYYASKTKVTLSAEKWLALTDKYSFVIGADYTYRSEQSQYPSSKEAYVMPSSNLFNARLGLSAGNWSIYAFGRNLGNEAFTRQLSPSAYQKGGVTQVLDANSRRLVGLQLEAKL